MKENPVSVTLTAFLLFLAVLFVVHWCINFHCRKWLVMRWDSWGLNSPKNRLMITRCPDKRAQSQICSSVASVARRTVHTIRWVHQNSKNEIGTNRGIQTQIKGQGIQAQIKGQMIQAQLKGCQHCVAIYFNCSGHFACMQCGMTQFHFL